jgi:hypothetical protein
MSLTIQESSTHLSRTIHDLTIVIHPIEANELMARRLYRREVTLIIRGGRHVLLCKRGFADGWGSHDHDFTFEGGGG